MAPRIKLDAKTLEDLGATALFKLLIDISNGNPVLTRRIKMTLAAKQGGGALKKQIQKRLGELRKSRSYIDWRQGKPFVSEISTLHRSITRDLAKESPAEALEMLWLFIGIAGPCFERYDDSRGSLGQIFADARQDMGDIALKAQINPKALAKQLLPAIRKNEYAEYDGLIPILSPALGPLGLSHLRDLIEAKPAGNSAYWKQIALQEIADALGDVNAYMSQYSPDLQKLPRVAAQIALRLLSASRAQEALDLLDNVEEVPSLERAAVSGRYADLSWHRARTAALDALGRPDEAQAVRLFLYEATLNTDALRDYLDRLKGFDDVEAEDKALAVAATYSDIHISLQFLLKWPALDTAAKMIEARFNEIDGRHYELLVPAARVMEARHCLAAALLHRTQIDFALQNARSKRYRHAARHLLACESLDGSIANYGGFSGHAAYEDKLREQHGRKTSFWALVDAK